MSRIVLLALGSLLFALGSPPAAADTLLVEVHGVGYPFDSPTVRAGLTVKPPNVHPSDLWPRWEQSWSLGATFPVEETIAAPSEFVAGLQSCLVDRDCQVEITTGNLSNSNSLRFGELWEATWMGHTTATWLGHTTATYVPRIDTIGNWQLTNITRTIHSGALRWDGRYYYGQLDQTVRFYGVAVPEPAGVLLFVMGLMLHGVSRRCRG